MGLFSKKADPAASAATATEATLPDGSRVSIKQQINCLGDSCPRPQLMTKKALTGASPGEVFEVMVDNPTSMEAIPPMMKDLVSTHLATVRADRHWRVFVRKD
ncbi:MAG: sulfurtransferase TusA family protein [Thiobacillus sp.]